jgi:hypothetical protein
VELASLDQVRAEAWRALCGIAMEETAYPAERLELSLRVRDAANTLVYEISLSIKGNTLPH